MTNSQWILFFVHRDALPQPFKDDFAIYAAIGVCFLEGSTFTGKQSYCFSIVYEQEISFTAEEKKAMKV